MGAGHTHASGDMPGRGKALKTLFLKKKSSPFYYHHASRTIKSRQVLKSFGNREGKEE